MQEISSGEFRWLARVESYSCSLLSPKKETKFRGMKTFIAYQLTPSVRSSITVDYTCSRLFRFNSPKEPGIIRVKIYYYYAVYYASNPLLLWYCWLGDKKGIWHQQSGKVLLWEIFLDWAQPGVISRKKQAGQTKTESNSFTYLYIFLQCTDTEVWNHVGHWSLERMLQSIYGLNLENGRLIGCMHVYRFMWISVSVLTAIFQVGVWLAGIRMSHSRFCRR